MTLQPLYDRVLIQPIESTTSPGGIVIPDTAKEKPKRGTVVAVGTGKVNTDGKSRPLSVKKNDIVWFSPYTGTEVRIDGVSHVVIREEELLGVEAP